MLLTNKMTCGIISIAEIDGRFVLSTYNSSRGRPSISAIGKTNSWAVVFGGA
jgi:hypothetical protein